MTENFESSFNITLNKQLRVISLMSRVVNKFYLFNNILNIFGMIVED